MNRILVTGASGFIGSNLVPQLSEAGYDVAPVDIESGDVADESTWARFPACDVAIHLAGKSFVPDSWDDPVSFIRANVLGTVSALNFCKKHHVHLIYLSSYLYGNPKTLPISEISPLSANNPYALSKVLSEDVCRFFSNSLGVKVTIFRPFNVYGPGQRENFLIPSIIRQVVAGKIVRVKDLEPKRDYIYVGDVVHAILLAINCESKFSIMNLGSGESHSVEEIIRIIQNLKNTNIPIFSIGDRRKDEVMNTIADITEAKRRLGWTPSWNLKLGLESTLGWYGGT